MIDLLGRRYIIEHIATDYRRRKVSEAYQIYLTDCLKGIGDLCAKYISRDGSAELVKKRYAELLHPVKEDTRSGEEIANDIMKRAGLSFVGE